MNEPYYCTRCQHDHHRGKIYDAHRKYDASGIVNELTPDQIDPWTGSPPPSGFRSVDWSDLDDKPKAPMERTMNHRLACWEWDDPDTGERRTQPLSPLEEIVHAEAIARAKGEKWGFWAKRRAKKHLKTLRG